MKDSYDGKPQAKKGKKGTNNPRNATKTPAKSSIKPKTPKKSLPQANKETKAILAEKREEAKKMGRPTVFKPEFVDLARKFCLLGADDKDLARMFEVDERTINRWKDDHPDFCQSIKEGKEIADAEVASKLYHRALGYSHPAVKIAVDAKTGMSEQVAYTEHYPPDTQAAMFWLKNRQKAKWRDTQLVGNDPDNPLAAVVLVPGKA